MVEWLVEIFFFPSFLCGDGMYGDPTKKVRQVKELKKKGKNEKKNFSSRSYHHSIQYIFSNLKIVCIHHPIHIIILILFYTLHFFPSIFFRLDFFLSIRLVSWAVCVCLSESWRIKVAKAAGDVRENVVQFDPCVDPILQQNVYTFF